MLKPLSLRQLTQEDAVQLNNLAQSVGWSFSIPHAQFFLKSTDTALGYFNRNQQLVGTATLFTFGEALATLGNVIVHEDYQSHGIGRDIVTRCLQRSQANHAPTALIATQMGYPLYENLGFRTVDSIIRCVLEPEKVQPGTLVNPDLPLQRCSLIDGADVSTLRNELLHLDAKAFGANRRTVYAHLLEHVSVAVVAYDKFRINGFLLVSERPELWYAGPVIAETPELAAALISKLLALRPNRVRVDVSKNQRSFLSHLKGLGFTETQKSPLMLKGGPRLPGLRHFYFGTLDPALG